MPERSGVIGQSNSSPELAAGEYGATDEQIESANRRGVNMYYHSKFRPERTQPQVRRNGRHYTDKLIRLIRLRTTTGQ